jgi:hypothetical protein
MVPFSCKKGGEMGNVQKKINKLLMAMRQQGIVYKINTQQFYSEKQDRICTKLILWEEHPKRDGEVFYSKVELLKYLAERWKEVREDGEGKRGEDGAACPENE